MFHPVGSQPPSVYWRRRLLAAGSLVILIVLVAVTISALTSSGSGAPAGGSSSTPVAAGDDSSGSTTPAHHSSAGGGPSSTSGGQSSSPAKGAGSSAPTTGDAPTSGDSPTGSATVQKCHAADLEVAAVVGQQSYRVGQNPMVELQVTNAGTAPCAQDLADKQVLLKVYNGVSRVWGSHDCQIQPGKKVLTLAVGAPVLITVKWSGETSRPHCAGTRQHVGAGTYTLYAALSGKAGTAAKFTIS